MIKKLNEDNVHFYLGLEAYNDLSKTNFIREKAVENSIQIIPFNEVCILKKSDEEVLRALEGIKNGWNINDINFNLIIFHSTLNYAFFKGCKHFWKKC